MRNKTLLIIIGMFVIVSLMGVAYADTWTCPQGSNGRFCVEYSSQDACSANCTLNGCRHSEAAGIDSCRSGVCYDSRRGICAVDSVNGTKIGCKTAGGTFFGTTDLNNAGRGECRKGCCFLGDDANLMTRTQCEVYSSSKGVKFDFDPTIQSESTCNIKASSGGEGACITISGQTKSCKFTTQDNCNRVKGDYHKNMLCSNPSLNTSCQRQKATGCVKGLDEVYWFDSCGNRENIYDSNVTKSWNGGRVLSKISSCVFNFTTGSSSCGNCDRVQGSYCSINTADDSPKFACKSLRCRDENGRLRQNGESWCNYQGTAGKMIGVGGFSRSADTVGSRQFREICIDGKVKEEACGDFRSEVCVQGKDQVDDNLTHSRCVNNDWQACFDYNDVLSGKTGETRRSAENGVRSRCNADSLCYFKETNLLINEGSERVSASLCVPKYAPGFDVSNLLNDNSASACSKGSKTYYLPDNFVITDAGGIVEEANDICSSLGDCGAKANIAGEITDNYIARDGTNTYELGSLYLEGLRNYSSMKDGISLSPPVEEIALSPPTNGLVAYWEFNEGTGNVSADSSGNGNNASLNNETVWINGKDGKGIQLTRTVGTDGKASAAYGNFTISRSVKNYDYSGGLSYGGWIKVNASKGLLLLGFCNNAADHSGCFSEAIDKGLLYYGESKANVALTQNVWHHVFVTIAANGNGVLYVDGKISGTFKKADPKDASRRAFNAITLFFTAKGTISTGYSIDDIVIYNRALSLAEVGSLYGVTASSLGVNSGNVAYWKFDEGTGNVSADSSGNGNTGTFGGVTKGVTNWVNGKIGKAVRLGGKVGKTSAFTVFVGGAASSYNYSNGLSFGGWVNATVTKGNVMGFYNAKGAIIDRITWGGNKYGYDDWKIKNELQQNKTVRSIWHHVFVTIAANGNGVLYVDGKEEKKFNTAARPVAGGSFKINQGFIVDEVRIYNRSLTASDVFDLFNGTISAPPVVINPAVNYTFNVTVINGTMGTVTSAVDSPSIQASCENNCVMQLNSGIRVTLTAHPNTGYEVKDWINCASDSENSCGVIMDSNKTVRVVFGLKSANPPASIRALTFTCSPWSAVDNGDKCEQCGKDGFPCSKYSCMALGKHCKLINENTRSAECIEASPSDVNPPLLSPLNGVLLNGYEYSAVSNTGYRLKGPQSDCLGELQAVRFGISTNESAVCKYDLESKGFDRMAYGFIGEGLSTKNHTQILLVPSLESLGYPGIDPNRTANFNVYVRCKDVYGNANDRDYVINACVRPGDDLVPPEIVAESSNLRYAGFSAQSLTSSILTNEPADCRYDSEDKAYSSMTNAMTCANRIEDKTEQGWRCSAPFNLSTGNSVFYIRCLDQPWLVQSDGTSQAQAILVTEDENGNAVSTVINVSNSRTRNEMPVGYQFVIRKADSSLSIANIGVDNQSIMVGSVPAALNVEVRTTGGVGGNATCYFLTNTSSEQFYYTGGTVHRQSLLFPAGNSSLTVVCEDSTGDSVNRTALVNILLDNTSPQITRVFNINGTLNLVTSENAECRFVRGIGDSCGFAFTNGTLMTGNYTVHTTLFNQSFTNSIKCKDAWGNEPGGNCSIIVAKGFKFNITNGS